MSKLHISKGNIKIGNCYNMSLTPLKTCSAAACMTCGKKGNCYALKSYIQYPGVRTAWDDNTDLAINNLVQMETDLRKHFAKHSTGYFRLHVAGDFVTVEYAQMWARIAADFPNVKFLAFTKQFDNVREIEFPSNFSLVLSAWKGLEIPADLQAKYMTAYCVEPEDEIPEHCIECPGSCENCMSCWDLHKTGWNVAFHKH